MNDDKGRGLRWLLLSLIVLVLDQWTKHLAVSNLPFGEPVPVFPYLNLTLTSNPGGAFSVLGEAGGWQRWLFILASSAVSLVLVVWLHRLPRGQKLLAVALALVLGGAVGNLWDRVTLGEVTDFVDAYYVNTLYGTQFAGERFGGRLFDGYDYRGNVFHDGAYHHGVFYRGWHWPAFNLADSSICVGAGLLLIFAFRPGSKDP